MSKPSHRGTALILCTLVAACFAGQPAQAATPQTPAAQVATPHAERQASVRLLQLVAPIALYPDPLVAQMLAACAYPSEVAQASNWMQLNSTLTGSALAAQVDVQPWPMSVKAMTQFPVVLQNMNTNLPWTSALGQAWLQNPQGVLDAVQVLRQRARAAGKLRSTSEQTVDAEGSNIAIDATGPDFVYVPAYDPWTVYGAPIAAYPSWIDVPGVFYPGDDLFYGEALGIGMLAGAGWGWDHWGLDWHGRRIVHDHATHAGYERDPMHASEPFHERDPLHADAGERNFELAMGAGPHDGLGHVLGDHALGGHAFSGIGGEGEHGLGAFDGHEFGGQEFGGHGFSGLGGGEHGLGGHMGGGFGGGHMSGGFGGGHMGGGGGGHR
jgi:uncharacterized membrane protein YgcG